jgi:UDP-N-acetylmuramoylalanine--D-glutamate ligase
MSKINKVAIFGMGKSGKSALKLALKKGFEVYAVNKGPVDSWYRSEGLESVIESCSCFSEDDFRVHFPKMDEIIVSPGIPVTHPSLELAVAKGTKISSEIEFAYRETKHVPVIAITGTNGKTTTTTMIQEVLELAGKKVFCGGNIGTPYCDLALSGAEVDYAVIEVSSFQLETIHEFHPQIGLILNIFPNHSERYDRVIDYARAKFRMLINMNSEDELILGTENEFLDEIKSIQVRKSFFTKGHLPEEFKSKFNFKNAHARGEHNEANFYATYKVLEILNIQGLDELFQKFIESFKGVAHRLEFVLESQGLKIYNDAKSTNILATSTAIKAFNDQSSPLYLILGGKLRSEGDLLLPDLLPYKEKIEKIFLIGEVTERLFLELKNDFKVEKCFDVKSCLEQVKKNELKGNLVFSPSYPSFDQFKNYVDRGEKFKTWVREVFSVY